MDFFLVNRVEVREEHNPVEDSRPPALLAAAKGAASL
jgi:hypothetical protein